VPAAAIVCNPDPEHQYADTCGDMPWVLGGTSNNPHND